MLLTPIPVFTDTQADTRRAVNNIRDAMQANLETIGNVVDGIPATALPPNGSVHQLPWNASISAATAPFTPNQIRVTRFIPQRRLKISTLNFYVSTAGTGNAAISLWNLAGTTMLATTGAISTATMGKKPATLPASINLDSNTEYLLALTMDNTDARLHLIGIGQLGVYSDASVPIFGTASNTANAGVFPGTLGNISYNTINWCPFVVVTA